MRTAILLLAAAHGVLAFLVEAGGRLAGRGLWSSSPKTRTAAQKGQRRQGRLAYEGEGERGKGGAAARADDKPRSGVQSHHRRVWTEQWWLLFERSAKDWTRRLRYAGSRQA